ncbi:hypothetical protein A1O1_00785 [Capronia coronata CBS 617.96]|uniref:Uncharacterized protein n=1 Tax=Capronia coronata CBS 617.96 TaxID=1182541 RepID=W9YSY6_9EURO|nr:uncharacterized protein A1O1_00785 [Capronia coronata CBS 617.96]EXJ95663.1 hypothetical protein A1O1_00785 [Capronia coronata CBS 617.96]
MLYALLKVASPSEGEAIPPYSQPPSEHQHPASSRLDGRLSVLEACVDKGVFDTVQLRFRGIILSSVGCNSAIEDIITLTDVKPLSHFRPSTASTRSDSEKARHVDFYFELPANICTLDGVSRSLPLSATISGTTSTAPRGGLNDPQLIQGNCEVSYWVEAQFCLAGREVGFICEHVRMLSLYPRLRASLTKGLPLTIRAKPDLLARCRLQKSPALEVALYEPDMTIDHDTKSGKRQMSIPIAVTMDIHPPAAGADSLDARQSLKCSVEARFEAHTRFSSGPLLSNGERILPDEAISKSTASTQKSTVLFRPLPLYDDQDIPGAKSKRRHPYVATSHLDLSVPDAFSQPSLRWKHLTRTYTLHLSLNFHGLQGAPRYSVCRHIPLSVSAHAPISGEAPKNDVIVSILEANDNLDAEGIMTTLRPSDHIPGEKGIEQTRSPPPPYFR